MPGIKGKVKGWPKAIPVGGEGDGGGKQQPPLVPSRFAEQLRRRRFTNGADFDVVCDLYERTLRDGFGARALLAYGSCGWGDAEVDELAATLRDVAHPEVVELDLSDNKELTSLAALGAAIGGGAFASLQIVNLFNCQALASLPAELASLTSLRTLKLSHCFALTRMPDLSGLPQLEVKLNGADHLKAWEAGGRKGGTFDLDRYLATDPFPRDATEIKLPPLMTALPGWVCRRAALQTLDLEECSKLTSLPAGLASLRSLQTLKLYHPSRMDAKDLTVPFLTRMPDLSGLLQLKVKNLPFHLNAWEKGGRKAGEFERNPRGH